MKKQKLTKAERLQKDLDLALTAFHEAMKEWNSGARWAVYISEGNRKMGDIPNVSLLPLVTCTKESRETCGCEGCYAVKLMRIYPSVRRSWARNTVLLIKDPQAFYRGLRDWLENHLCREFRFNVAGDFASPVYMWIAFQLVQDFPGVTFLAFTKAFENANKYAAKGIPENFKLLFSEWPGKPVNNPYNLPCTMVINSADDLPEGVKLCGGNCERCRCHGVGCWELENGEKVAFIKH